MPTEVGTLPPSVAEVFGSLVVGPAFGADGGARFGGFNPYLNIIILIMRSIKKQVSIARETNK